MKMYVVLTGFLYPKEFIGVFDSKEKAEECENMFQQFMKNKIKYIGYRIIFKEIEVNNEIPLEKTEEEWIKFKRDFKLEKLNIK